jgi:hypothetical protein
MLNALALFLTFTAQGADRLPDLSIWPERMYDNAIDTNTMAGHKLFRLTTATPNLGTGALELRGGAVSGSTQQVYQRIYQSNGGSRDRLAGTFTFHQQHQHIHFDDWCVYRLRQVGANQEVGPVVRTGSKASFCILDLQVFDSSVPGYSPVGQYRTCGATVQGLTPGWADVYNKELTDQWVDITGVPDGTYWLEAEVDPENLIEEADETNNVGRILVAIGPPPPLVADRYEDNDTIAVVTGRPEAGENSPNLGMLTGLTVLDNLSMDDTADYFRFRLTRSGRAGDYIRVDSPYRTGDLDLRLYNSSGGEVRASVGNTNLEQVSLLSLPAGTYFAKVYGSSGTNPGYRLTIQPAGNLAPRITVNAPGALGVYAERGIETFPVSWTATDPESQPTTVALYRSAAQTFNKASVPIGGYDALDGSVGAANVNTAEMPLGRWYLYARVTDGGAMTGGFAPGPFTVYKKGDLNFDGRVNWTDYREYQVGLRRRAPYPAKWRFVLDIDRDGDFDSRDLDAWMRLVVRG